MYFSGNRYFNQRVVETNTGSKSGTNTLSNKPKPRKKGKSTRKKKAKQKYNLTQLKKQLGNDMVIKLLLRLVEGKAGARPVGRPPQQQPSLKKPRSMRIARGSGLPGREKQKLQKKKQGETDQQFFRRVEDYVMENNPAFLYFSQILQQDRERAEALIRQQIAALRQQPVVVQQAVERQAEVDKGFVRELVRRLRTAEGASAVDRQKIVREGLKQYTDETGDRLVSSDEEFFYDLARTRGRKKRQEAESRIGQRFYGAGETRRKTRKRVVAEPRTTTLGELGGDEPFTQAERRLQEGFTTEESTSAGEALRRFQERGSFRREPENPYDRGIPTTAEEEARILETQRYRPPGRPRFAETGRETKAQRDKRLRQEAERRRLEEQGFSTTSESGLDSPIRVVKTGPPREPEPERQPESDTSSGENPLSPQTFQQRVREAERERRFAPLQKADTGEIEQTQRLGREQTGRRTGRSPTAKPPPIAQTPRETAPPEEEEEADLSSPRGIQGKQKSFVDAGLSALTNEGNRVGQQLAQGLLGAGTAAAKKAKGVITQAQTFKQFADEGREFELKHGVFGRQGFLDDVMTAEKRAASREFQRKHKARTEGTGEFSSEGEFANQPGYETLGSGAEEFEDYFAADRPELEPTTKVLDPEALRAAGVEQREYLRGLGQDVDTSTGEGSTIPDLEPGDLPTGPSLAELAGAPEPALDTGGETSGTEYSEEERLIDFSKLQQMKPKTQKKVFKRLQGQLGLSDFEGAKAQAELDAFKGLTTRQEQLEADLQSLPRKKQIAQQFNRLGEVEILERELRQKQKEYQELDFSGGSEVDDLIGGLQKEYYTSGSEETSGVSGLIEEALGEFEKGSSVGPPGSVGSSGFTTDSGVSDLALLANTNFRGRSQKAKPPAAPPPAPPPQEFEIDISEEASTGAETAGETDPELDLQVLGKGAKLLRELDKQKDKLFEKLDARTKTLQDEYKLAEDFLTKTDIEKAGALSSVQTQAILDTELPRIEKEINRQTREERELRSLLQITQEHLLGLSGNQEAIEQYERDNERTIPDKSKLTEEQRKNQEQTYLKSKDELAAKLREYELYRNDRKSKLRDRRKQLIAIYEELEETPYKTSFKATANEAGRGITSAGWDEYESLVLAEGVKQGLLTQEQLDKIRMLKLPRRAKTKSILDSGKKYREEWIIKDNLKNSWWRGYIDDAIREIERSEGKVKVGAKPFTEAQLEERGKKFDTRFEEFASSLFTDLTEQQQAIVKAEIEKEKTLKSYRELRQGKGGPKKIEDLEKRIQGRIGKALTTETEGSTDTKTTTKSRKKRDLARLSFENWVQNPSTEYLKFKDGKLQFLGDTTTQITTQFLSGNNQQGSSFKVITPSGQYNLVKNDNLSEYPSGYRITKEEPKKLVKKGELALFE